MSPFPLLADRLNAEDLKDELCHLLVRLGVMIAAFLALHKV